MTLDHPQAEQWIEGFGLRTFRHANTLCPENRFLAIADALRSCSGEGERKAAQCAHAILLAASATTSVPAVQETLATKAKALMDESFADPTFDLAHLAACLGVHRSTLFRRFMDAYHVKPSHYLLSLRLQFGLNLVQNTALPIQEVALKAGFADANYFTRAIRQSTGRPPSSFRST